MNCIIIDDDKLSLRIIEEFVEKTEFLNLIDSYSNAIDAINAFNKNEIHLIFLDVEMPEMSGLEFLKTLKDPPQIIIVSSKDKYAIEAFEYDVTDYLLKPVSYARFYKAVQKAQGRYSSGDSEANDKLDEIFIKNNSSLIKLKYEDIYWIEALENYVVINTYDEKYTIHFTMKSISEKLPSNRFLRVHRSYIVNVNKINVIEDNTVIYEVADGAKVIPIGKSYKDKLMSYINLMSR
jgi:DNA-binding LytR/AlgR family response regulator